MQMQEEMQNKEAEELTHRSSHPSAEEVGAEARVTALTTGMTERRETDSLAAASLLRHSHHPMTNAQILGPAI